MKKIALIISIIAMSTISSFASSEIVIEGIHRIEGVNSGTRTFILSDSNGEVQRVTVNVNSPFAFNLSLDEGEYEYTVKEEPIEADGLTTDTREYHIRILVQDKPTIVLEGENGKVDFLEFADTYKGEDTELPKEEVRPPKGEIEEEPLDEAEEDAFKEPIKKIVERVKSGDSNNLIYLFAVLTLSIAGLGVLIIKKRR